MATNATAKIDAAAEQAYAEAAAKTAPKDSNAKKRVTKKAKAAKKVAKPQAGKTVAKKVAAKKVIKKAAAKKTAAKKQATPKKAKPQAKAQKASRITKIKDTIMAKANTNDFTKTAKEMAAEAQTRAKTAFAKTGELANEASEFGKGNVEAVVESGKILIAGMQELGREDLENGKAALETLTGDVKKFATVQSPTEFMQLQGEFARRNFDAVVSFGSKRTETLVKLYNDAFAPISNRVSMAAEKIRKAA